MERLFEETCLYSHTSHSLQKTKTNKTFTWLFWVDVRAPQGLIGCDWSHEDVGKDQVRTSSKQARYYCFFPSQLTVWSGLALEIPSSRHNDRGENEVQRDGLSWSNDDCDVSNTGQQAVVRLFHMDETMLVRWLQSDVELCRFQLQQLTRSRKAESAWIVLLRGVAGSRDVVSPLLNFAHGGYWRAH